MHIGELQWEANPRDGSSVPSRGFSIEVDFVSGTPEQLINRSSWERGIEENYALYGIEIDLVRDETLDEEALSSQTIVEIDSSDGVSVTEFVALYDVAYDGKGEKYLVVANKPGSLVETYKPGVWGGNWRYGIQMSGLFVNSIRREAESEVTENQTSPSTFASKTGYLTGFVEMHEIGHSLFAGEADDKPYAVLPVGEVYSGTAADDTPEVLQLAGNRGDQWSIMRRGWGSTTVFTSNGAVYWAFSIEEASTVSGRER